MHIALPKQSVFVRNFRKPSASVLIDVPNNYTLGDQEVSAIVHLISSSVPGLSNNDVAVVDQSGNLLTETDGQDQLGLAQKQLKYIKQIESDYSHKVEDLLVPLLGPGKIKVRVNAELDFTQHETTKEVYDDENPAIRSEQSMNENKLNNALSKGVPGAAANQQKANNKEEDGNKTQSEKSNQRSQSTKNYELSKTVSYVKMPVGHIKRLSVAILADDMTTLDQKTGKIVRQSLTPDLILQIKKLAQDAIGFNAQRGDTVTVFNRSFVSPQPMQELEEIPIWEQDWFWDVVKQGLGALFILYLVFGIIRPMFKSLATRGVAVSDLLTAQDKEELSEEDEKSKQLAGELVSHDEQMRIIKDMATNDPKRVAQVVKRWMDSD